MQIPDAEKAMKKEKIAIPFPHPHPPKDAKYKLQYDRPASINVTGSFPLKIATKTEDTFVIDLVVTMPKSLFQEKDYLNHRYFYKRAYYLACVTAGIKNSTEHEFMIEFDCLNGNQLQPVLVIHPSGNGDADDFSASKCAIRIVLAVPENTFAAHKLRPSSNCVRDQSAPEESAEKTAAPTPFYNATLQSDAAITPYLKLLHSAASKCDAYRDACILGRVWLRQRGFAGTLRKGGFGNFEWAALIAILLQSPSTGGSAKLSPGYSSYQLFKATLQFLAQNNLAKTPYIFDARDITVPKDDLAPAFFDGPRNINLLFKMTPWSYTRLQQEAKATIETLRDSLADHFESTFIVKTNLLTYHYDAVMEIPLSALGLDPAGEDYQQAFTEKCRKLHSTLTRALTDRITSLAVTTPDEAAWKVSAVKPSESQDKSIIINIGTDAANATRTVDLGPSAENKKEAAAFRQFWGEKAELRRFKDGSILESVVWSTKDTQTSVLEQIIRYIITRHITPEAGAEAHLKVDSFAHLIPAGRIQGQSGVTAFALRMNALSQLEKDIRGLVGLPLSIRHINAADPQLRYSAVDVESLQRPADIVIQFEGSARWPDDLCAIQRTKIAFLLKISDLLADEKPTYMTRVGLENQSIPSQNQSYLDIILPTGFSFRLRIHHDREASLLERQLKDKTLDAQSREAAGTALAAYKRDYLQIPAHTQALQRLCTRYPALSPSIRLTKRWFASHLLTPHFSPELIELLVLRTFLQPHPWSVPATASIGFLRTLLWLSRWDWRHVPLIVDLSNADAATAVSEVEGIATGGLDAEAIRKIQTRFEAWRQIDPAMNRVVLFAATNLDQDGTTWSDRGRPEKVVAARMTALARVATAATRAQEDRLLSSLSRSKKEAESMNMDIDTITPESLFISQLSNYDILIRLSPKHLHASKKTSTPRFKNLEIQAGPLSTEEKNNIGYAPAAAFAEDLRQIYGDAALWFWNPENPTVVAGLWNPVVTGQRNWKVKPGWNSVPVAGEKKGKTGGEEDEEGKGVHIVLNKGAICHEIKRLGGDLIAGIEVKG